MSIRRRAIRARVERDRKSRAVREQAIRIVDDVTTKLRADTYENLFLRPVLADPLFATGV